MPRTLVGTASLALGVMAALPETVAFSPANQPALHGTTHNTKQLTTVLSQTFNDDDVQMDQSPKKKGFFANFFEELDAFVDDATSRRLGNGAQYYGKRKSSFYGESDSNRKRNKDVADPSEDYRGPNTAGYFKWMPDAETGELKPVTRLKEKNIERKTRF